MEPDLRAARDDPDANGPMGRAMAFRWQPAWYVDAMKITIDRAGRVVLPKALRDAVGIAEGATLEATVRDGRIELEVPPAEVRIERQGDVLVAVPAQEVPTLRGDAVRATLDALRAER